MSGFAAIRNQPIRKEFQGTPIEKGAEMMSDYKNPAHLFMNIMARSPSMDVKVTKTQNESVSPMGEYQSASGHRASFRSRRRARLLGSGVDIGS